MSMRLSFRGGAAFTVVLFAGAWALTGCDSGPSALPARDHSPAAMAEAARAAQAAPAEQVDYADRAPTPQFRGKPLWSANKQYTAAENADYHFKRNGEAFDARTVDAYVAKAHDFVTDPPKGVQTIKRANGDTLFYDAKTNVFAVATKDGAPRTMFKPDNGAAYWETQKTKEAGTVASGARKTGAGQG